MKWIAKSRFRLQVSSVLFVLFIGIAVVKHFFFSPMKVIRSNVYSELFLIQNPIQDQDSLKQFIKKYSLQIMRDEFVGNEQQYQYYFKDSSKVELYYDLEFYKYFVGIGTHPFGAAGTAHFIDNKEDPGGFSSEYLDYYDNEKIAEINIRFCEEDTLNYAAVFRFYNKNTNDVINDTLLYASIR